MGLRRAERQRALQFLYALEFSGNTFEEEEEGFRTTNPKWRKGWKKFARELALLTHQNSRDLDREVGGALDNWRLQRLAVMDRLCLRMALCEFKYHPLVPIRVTMNEYIELAKVFGGDDSPGFVNGVLDQLAKQYKEKDFQIEKQKKASEPEEEMEAGTASNDDSDH